MKNKVVPNNMKPLKPIRSYSSQLPEHTQVSIVICRSQSTRSQLFPKAKIQHIYSNTIKQDCLVKASASLIETSQAKIISTPKSLESKSTLTKLLILQQESAAPILQIKRAETTSKKIEKLIKINTTKNSWCARTTVSCDLSAAPWMRTIDCSP